MVTHKGGPELTVRTWLAGTAHAYTGARVAPAAAAGRGDLTLGKGRRHQIAGWCHAQPHRQKCHIKGHQAHGTGQHL